jgi:acetyl esterase
LNLLRNAFPKGWIIGGLLALTPLVLTLGATTARGVRRPDDGERGGEPDARPAAGALDPEAVALLRQLEATSPPPLWTISAAEARQAMAARTAALAQEPEPLAAVEDRHIPGPETALPVRIYTPAGTGPFPLLVYFHGGGWVLGNLDTHDALCRALANEAGRVVVSVDYRLAPEHKHPAPLEDAYAATAWVAANAASLHGDPSRLAVGGDSAGGNLAAGVALLARDRRGPALTGQVLIYPVTDYSFDTPSYRDCAEGYFLTRDEMVWFWGQHLSSQADGSSPYASPLRAADLSGLPAAVVVTAEFDPLRDEGEAYGRRLAEAGVPVVVTRYPGMIHNFLRTARAMRCGREAIKQMGAFLRETAAGAG